MLLLLQVPPLTVFERTVVLPVQTVAVPVIAAGDAFTDIVVVAATFPQLLDIV